ncbi:hypothetical protein V6U81_23930 [Micromonospora sp. CPCC 205711]|uniref:hypothetical protein n=1 Tax=Micromonospora sp. CPCC 205547 TaxID=3122400 RepID=UPI002FF1817A
MTDLDERIARTLREHADGPVDTGRLVTAAVNGGRARRRRRRAVVGAALGVAVALGAGMALRTPTPAPSPTPAVTPSPTVVVPPRAPGVPGAAARPGLVGSDRAVLHFGVDPAVGQPVAWRSADRVETMNLDLGGGVLALVAVGADPQKVEFGTNFPYDIGPDEVDRSGQGEERDRRPGDAASRYNGLPRRLDEVTRGWVLRWRPAPGVYARVATLGDTDAEVRRVAAALRFDEARRCVTPMRLTTLPKGAWIGECEVSVRELPWPSEANRARRLPPGSGPAGPVERTSAVLTVRMANWASLPVRLHYSAETENDPRIPVHRTVGPWKVFESGYFKDVLGIPHTHLSMGRELSTDKGPYDADVFTVIRGLRVADDLGEPTSWE